MNVRCVQVVLFFSASNCAFSNVYYMYCSLCNNVIGLPSPCFSFFRLVSSLWLFIFSTFEHTFTITLMFAHFSVSLSLITKLLFCLLRLCSSSIQCAHITLFESFEFVTFFRVCTLYIAPLKDKWQINNSNDNNNSGDNTNDIDITYAIIALYFDDLSAV